MNPRALSVAVAALVVLAGCSGSDDHPTTTATSPDAPVLEPGTPGEPNTSLSGTKAVPPATPKFNDADVEFLQDMIVHHAQAVVMGKLAKGHLEDSKVTSIAARIADEQRPEMKGMANTLTGWGKKVPPEATNPNFILKKGHTNHSGMPGMATDAQLKALGKARGAAADKLYLDLMIKHHQGALRMCTELGRDGADERTSELGDDIAVVQTKQIEQMKAMRERL